MKRGISDGLLKIFFYKCSRPLVGRQGGGGLAHNLVKENV